MYFSWLAALLFVLVMPLQMKYPNACEHASPPQGMQWVCSKENPCDCRLETLAYRHQSGEETLKSESLEGGNTCWACRITFFVIPAYPEAARKGLKQGIVSASLVLTPEGEIQQVQIRSGDEQLKSAVESAFRRWRFTPGGRSESIPVSVKFVLSDDPTPSVSGASLLNPVVTARPSR